MTNRGERAHNSKHDRNWEIWRRHAVHGEKFKDIAKEFGISRSRAADVFETCDRRVDSMLVWNKFPELTTKLRDELLGVEFAFAYDGCLTDEQKGDRGYMLHWDDAPVYCWVVKKEK